MHKPRGPQEQGGLKIFEKYNLGLPRFSLRPGIRNKAVLSKSTIMAVEV